MRYGVEDVVGEDVAARPRGIGPPCAHAAKASTVFSVAAAPGPKMAAQDVARKSDAGAHEFAGWFARASPRRAAGRWDANPPRDAPARNAHVARTVATEATRATREPRGASSAGGRSGARSAPASAIAAPARGVVPPRTGGRRLASANHVDDEIERAVLSAVVAQQMTVSRHPSRTLGRARAAHPTSRAR